VSQGTLIGIDQLVLGATTTCDLLDLDGRVAVSTGTLITPQLLKRIKHAGIIGLVAGRPDYAGHHVTSARPSIDVIASRISEMQRRSGIAGSNISPAGKFARQVLGETFTKIASGRLPEMDILDAVVDRILHETELDRISPLPAPRQSHDTLVERLVDGAIDTGILMGWHMKKAGESNDVCRAATLGGLLHDTGLLFVSHKAITCTGALTQSDRREIRRHPYLAIRALSPLGKRIPGLTQDIILLHHERMDGRGYPFGRSCESVPKAARLAHIIDAYTALVSPRPHRASMSPHRAISILLRESGSGFCRNTLREFIERTGRYPLGSAVVLSSNEVGVVVGIGSGGPFKPVVDIYFSKHHKFSQTAQRIDLSSEPMRYVRHVMR
jgi:hypothetical protein